MNEREREREICCRPTSALVWSHPLIEALNAFPLSPLLQLFYGECTYTFISNLICVHNLLDTDVLQECLDWSVGLCTYISSIEALNGS